MIDAMPTSWGIDSAIEKKTFYRSDVPIGMPRTKPKVNPNSRQIAGEKLSGKFEILRFSVSRRTLEDTHRELAVLPEPLAYVEYWIALMAPADLWFSTDAM